MQEGQILQDLDKNWATFVPRPIIKHKNLLLLFLRSFFSSLIKQFFKS